jgi:uncharacterized protein (TIGR03437 family)
MRSYILLLCACFPLAAQIRDLATTNDGAVLYFSTSYRLKGSSDVGYSKIFRYTNSEFQLFREIELIPNYSGSDTNFYLAVRPSVSGDGRTVVYTASRNCYGGSHCVFFVSHQGFLAVAGGVDQNLTTGMLTLSPDGRYVLISGIGGAYEPYDVAFSDLTQGAIVNLGGLSALPIGDGRQGIAKGGTVLLADSQGPFLWNEGQVQRLSFARSPIQARMSADARMIVYEAAPPAYELHSFDVLTGRDLVLASSSAGEDGFHPSLTADGSLVAYVLHNQLVVSGTRSPSWFRLLTAPEGITEEIIAGDGNVVYAATRFDRLLRAYVASGLVTELSAAVAHVLIAGGALVPGARLDLFVPSAPIGATDPAILTSAGKAPIIARSATSVTFQIPWEAKGDSTVQFVVPANPSQFEEVKEPSLAPAAAYFYTMPPYALAAHQDFRSLVSEQSPAKPGEIIHLYFTGLGAVTPRIATGAVTPLSPLYRLQTPPVCQFQEANRSVDATILFAGLAPGFIGVDQVDLQIPSGLTTTYPLLNCGSGIASIPVAP